MSVICDTSKLRIYRDRSKNLCIVYIRGLRNRNGKDVKFSVTRDINMSDEEIYTIFFEKLERGELVQNRSTGGGTLRQDARGGCYLEYKDDASNAPHASAVKPAVRTIVGGQVTLFDPHAPESKALLGRPVLGSTTFVFSEGTCVLGTLESVNGMFHVRTQDGIVKVPFIRERRPEPLNLNDVSVRRGLLGRILISKDGTHELLVTSLVREGNCWKANGLSSGMLMNRYTFEDGSEIVASA